MSSLALLKFVKMLNPIGSKVSTPERTFKAWLGLILATLLFPFTLCSDNTDWLCPRTCILFCEFVHSISLTWNDFFSPVSESCTYFTAWVQIFLGLRLHLIDSCQWITYLLKFPITCSFFSWSAMLLCVSYKIVLLCSWFFEGHYLKKIL